MTPSVRYHWSVGDPKYLCTAPSADEYIAELEQDSKLLDWLLANPNRHVGQTVDGWVVFFASSPISDPWPTPREALREVWRSAGSYVTTDGEECNGNGRIFP